MVAESYLKASNAGAGDAFRTTLSLSDDGTTLAVSAPNEDSAGTGVGATQNDENADGAGTIYLYVEGESWGQQAYVKASNTDAFDAFDAFGVSLALSASGDVLVVGANNEDSAASSSDNESVDSGAVYAFNRFDTDWKEASFNKSTGQDDGDRFGGSVVLDGLGSTLAVGATGEDGNGSLGDNSLSGAGAAYVFTAE